MEWRSYCLSVKENWVIGGNSIVNIGESIKVFCTPTYMTDKLLKENQLASLVLRSGTLTPNAELMDEMTQC